MQCAGQMLPFGGYDTASCEPAVWSDSKPGAVFVDAKHQSEASGAWLEALVVYASLLAPPCLPPPTILKQLGVSLYAELTTAARTALQEQYSTHLAECALN